MNLQKAMVRVFERKHELLQGVVTSERADNQGTASTCIEHNEVGKSESRLLTPTEAQRQARHARRKNRYEEVIKLREQGMSQTAIAMLVGLHRDTVHRYIQAPSFSEQVRPNRHKSKLDPYKEYLHQRWTEGQQNVTHLIAQIREQGFRDSDTIVFDYLRPIREEPAWMEAYQQRKQQTSCGVSKKPLSARSAAWLFVCNPRKLKWRQICWQLEPLRVEDDELGRAYHLVQDFRTMIVQRQASVLARWCQEALESGIPELCSLAAGIYRDYDAVYGALETSFSNGQTEGAPFRCA